MMDEQRTGVNNKRKRRRSQVSSQFSVEEGGPTPHTQSTSPRPPPMQGVPSSVLVDVLVEQGVCGSKEEASVFVDEIENECVADKFDLLTNAQEEKERWLQGLQDYLDLSKTQAENVIAQCLLPPGAPSDQDQKEPYEESFVDKVDEKKSFSPDIHDSSEKEPEDGQYIGEGDCKLCERNIKLTNHHLIPRSTWPRIKTRLQNAFVANDPSRATLILGDGLAHLAPDLMLMHDRPSIQRLLQTTCNICRQCHSMVHRVHDNMTLATQYNTVDKLLSDQKIAAFCKWANRQRTGKYSK